MKFLHKLVVLFLTVLFIFQISNAETGVKIKVNGKYVSSDVEAFISDSRTYVPIRFISQALNVDRVYWDQASSSVTIQDNAKTLLLFVNKNYAYINNKYTQLDSEVLLVNSRTFVPLKFISEIFDAKVSWNENSNTVIIQTDTKSSTQNSTTSTNSDSNNSSTSTYSVTYNYDDAVYWLSRIIEAEAGAEPFEGKVAVGEVILNRVNSSEFPNTIWEVIFDKNFGIQFEPVANGTIYNTPSTQSITAAKTALNGTNYVGKCLYFLNPTIAKSTWISKNRQYYKTIAKHDFYI